MAITLIDGFDVYGNVADMAEAGWGFVGANPNLLVYDPTGGRFGTGCLKWTGFGNSQNMRAQISCQGVNGQKHYYGFSVKPGLDSEHKALFVITGYTNEPMFSIVRSASGDLIVLSPNSDPMDAIYFPLVGAIQNVLPAEVWTHVEIAIKWGMWDGATAVNGEVWVFINGVQRGHWTGVNTRGYSGTGALLKHPMFLNFFGERGTSLDDLVCHSPDVGGTSTADARIGDLRVQTLLPDGIVLNSWNYTPPGSNHNSVRTPIGTLNDGDVSYASSGGGGGNLSQYSLDPLVTVPGATHSIVGIQARTIARKDSAGTMGITSYPSLGVVIGEPLLGLGDEYRHFRHGCASQAALGVPFTVADINNLKITFEATF